MSGEYENFGVPLGRDLLDEDRIIAIWKGKRIRDLEAENADFEAALKGTADRESRLAKRVASAEAELDTLRQENAALKAGLEQIENGLGIRLNDHLCEMNPGRDDSICGFNEAWDVVRGYFQDRRARSLLSGQEKDGERRHPQSGDEIVTGEYENFGVPLGRGLLAELEAFRQENAALKGALEPFAEAADLWDVQYYDNQGTRANGPGMEDHRRAYSLLSGQEKG